MLKKKITGLLLAAAMIITMLPASALTARAEEAADETAVVTEQTDEALPEETAEAAEEEEPVFAEQATTISTVTVTGVSAPSVGSYASTAGIGVSSASHCSISSVYWFDYFSGDRMNSTDRFRAERIYRLMVTFEPNSGYVFADSTYVVLSGVSDSAVADITVIGAGAPSGGVYPNRCAYVYFYALIPTASFFLYDAPCVGRTAGDCLTAAAAPYTNFSVSAARWYDYSQGSAVMSDTDRFQPGGTYRVQLVLTPNEHYRFTDIGSFSVDIGNIPSDRYTVREYAYNTVYPTGEYRPDKRVVELRFDMPAAFTDVTDEDAFYYIPVYWAAMEGITTGWSDGTFRPWNTCNRAAVITFLWRLAGEPSPQGAYPFNDPTGNDEFDRAIAWAAENQIAAGFSDGTFRPWNTCNRAAIVTFLYRYAKLQNGGADVLPEDAYNNPSNRFPDMTGNEEFDRAIIWAYWDGVATGFDDGTFRPWNNCNRASVVCFIYRMDRTMGMVG